MNIQDAVDRARTAHGKRNPHARLTEEQVRQISLSSESNVVLARLYGVHPTTILRARSGGTWAKFSCERVNRKRRVMTPEIMAAIAAEDGTLREVAERLGWDQASVHKARRLAGSAPVSP